MKSKGNSLYEVLKSASRPAGADGAGAPSPESPASSSPAEAQATLQERLAAYKAAKLAAANQPSPSAGVESASTMVLEPDPTPIPAPAATRLEPPMIAPSPHETESTPLPAAPSKGPGERVVRLTYNTVLFGGMIVVGLVFAAYAVGLHIGKSNAAAENQVESPRASLKSPSPILMPAPAPVPPPVAPKKEYTIRLGEWKYVSTQDRVKALALADDPELKKALERAGHKSFEKAFINRGNEPRMALYVDRFPDHTSDAAKAALTAMKNFKFRTQTPFAQAAFEEVQPR